MTIDKLNEITLETIKNSFHDADESIDFGSWMEGVFALYEIVRYNLKNYNNDISIS